MNTQLERSLIAAVHSNKQSHFDAVLEDMRQWHRVHGSFVEQEFAQQIVDIFEFSIRRDHRTFLNSAVCLLASWIVHHASEEAANKMFDVVNNAWLARCLLENVDDPRMLQKCNVEDILYNQAGVNRRAMDTNELMLFVQSPAHECIKYVFSDPFVVRALNQEEQSDKRNRLSENDHIFWALTDPGVDNALTHVLNSLLAQDQTRWIGYYMKTVCAQTSLSAYNKLLDHPKFSAVHMAQVEAFFSKAVSFHTPAYAFISQFQPHGLFVKAATSHFTNTFSGNMHSPIAQNDMQQILDALNPVERSTVLCGALEAYQNNTCQYPSFARSTLRVFADFAHLLTAADLDGLLERLPENVLDVVRKHPVMLQRILHNNLSDVGDVGRVSKRKI